MGEPLGGQARIQVDGHAGWDVKRKQTSWWDCGRASHWYAIVLSMFKLLA